MFSCYMAGATWNCCRLSTFCVDHTTNNHAPCHITSCKATYVGCIHVCVAVTCHLHFGQNVQDLLHASAVTQTLLVSHSPSAVADRQAKGKLDSILLLPCLKRAETLSQFFSHRPLAYQCVSRTEEPVNIPFKMRLKKLHHFCCRHCSYKKRQNSLQHVTLGMPNTALTWPLIDERQSAMEHYILKDLSFSKHVQYVEEIKVQHNIQIFSNSPFSSNKRNKRS